MWTIIIIVSQEIRYSISICRAALLDLKTTIVSLVHSPFGLIEKNLFTFLILSKSVNQVSNSDFTSCEVDKPFNLRTIIMITNWFEVGKVHTYGWTTNRTQNNSVTRGEVTSRAEKQQLSCTVWRGFSYIKF